MITRCNFQKVFCKKTDQHIWWSAGFSCEACEGFQDSYSIELLLAAASVSANCKILESWIFSHIYVKNDKNKTSYIYVCTTTLDQINSSLCNTMFLNTQLIGWFLPCTKQKRLRSVCQNSLEKHCKYEFIPRVSFKLYGLYVKDNHNNYSLQ